MNKTYKNELILALEAHQGFYQSIYMVYHVDGADTVDFDEAQALLDFFEQVDEIYYLDVGSEILECYLKKDNDYYVLEFFYDVNKFSSFSVFWSQSKEKLLNLSKEYQFYLCNLELPEKLKKIDEKILLEKNIIHIDKTKIIKL